MEDDEEELVWEEEEDFTVKAEENSTDNATNGLESTTKFGSSQTVMSPSAEIGTNTSNPTASKEAQTAGSGSSDNVGSHHVDHAQVAQIISLNEHMKERVSVLERDNERLLSHEEQLNRRIQELEARLAAQELAAAQESARARVSAPPTPAGEVDAAADATTTPPSKRRSGKSSAPRTTPPTNAYHNAETPPVDAISTGPVIKKKGSTAKKLFDSPTAAPPPAISQELKINDAPMVDAEVEAPLAHATVADHVSQSSEDSAVVVNRVDAAAMDDDQPAAPSSQSQSSLSVPGAKGAFSSQETAKYLAALDDQDEEEDGWN